jgi:hypothetical protein
MTEQAEEHFRGFVPSYQSNLAHLLGELWAASIEEAPSMYYRAARQFLRFLPIRVSAKFVKDIDRIEMRLRESAAEITAKENMDDLTAASEMIRARETICVEETDRLVEKIVQELDNADMLEFRGIKPRRPSRSPGAGSEQE